MVWTIAILAVLVILGVVYWRMEGTGRSTASNPPAVTTAPAPVPGRQAPPPEETTGQAAPPAQR